MDLVGESGSSGGDIMVVRSSVSTLVEDDLCSRGDTRRLVRMGLVGPSLVDLALELREVDEAFEDTECKGRRAVVGGFRRGLDGFPGSLAGEDNVKSRVSVVSGTLNNGGGGADISLDEAIVLFARVGVTHTSRVLCVFFPGVRVTDLFLRRPGSSPVMDCVSAFFAGNQVGEGIEGDSARSSISTPSKRLGVDGSSKISLVLDGSVLALCNGPLFLLLVTLDGSSMIGEKLRRRASHSTGFTGDEDNRSTISGA